MDLKINAGDWATLGRDEQTKIESIVTGFFKDGKIVPDPATPSTGQAPVSLGNPFCKAACDIAESAAVVACNAIGNPIGIAACVALAHAAGDACRGNC